MFYDEPIKDVYQKLDSNETGLSSEEAVLRQKKFGPNIIDKKKRGGPIKIFADQFKNFLGPLVFQRFRL